MNESDRRKIGVDILDRGQRQACLVRRGAGDDDGNALFPQLRYEIGDPAQCLVSLTEHQDRETIAGQCPWTVHEFGGAHCLRMDAARLFQLERRFLRDGEADAAADDEEAVGLRQDGRAADQSVAEARASTSGKASSASRRP